MSDNELGANRGVGQRADVLISKPDFRNFTSKDMVSGYLKDVNKAKDSATKPVQIDFLLRNLDELGEELDKARYFWASESTANIQDLMNSLKVKRSELSTMQAVKSPENAITSTDSEFEPQAKVLRNELQANQRQIKALQENLATMTGNVTQLLGLVATLTDRIASLEKKIEDRSSNSPTEPIKASPTSQEGDKQQPAVKAGAALVPPPTVEEIESILADINANTLGAFKVPTPSPLGDSTRVGAPTQEIKKPPSTKTPGIELSGTDLQGYLQEMHRLIDFSDDEMKNAIDNPKAKKDLERILENPTGASYEELITPANKAIFLNVLKNYLAKQNQDDMSFLDKYMVAIRRSVERGAIPIQEKPKSSIDVPDLSKNRTTPEQSVSNVAGDVGEFSLPKGPSQEVVQQPPVRRSGMAPRLAGTFRRLKLFANQQPAGITESNPTTPIALPPTESKDEIQPTNTTAKIVPPSIAVAPEVLSLDQTIIKNRLLELLDATDSDLEDSTDSTFQKTILASVLDNQAVSSDELHNTPWIRNAILDITKKYLRQPNNEDKALLQKYISRFTETKEQE